MDNSENSCLSEPILKACNAKKTVGLLDRQRLYKSEAEVALMREAGRVGSEAFVETIKWSKGKTQESFLAAKMEFEAKLRAASGLAYVPVVAGGDRANIIHYVRNDRLIEPGQMVLMDAGAKVSGYCNDITRSWPISGKFSPAQREIYEAVLRVQKKCIQAVRRRRELSSNISISVLNQLSTVSFIDELDNLGFRNPESIVNQVFPHSVGHQIGLDLHDCQSISYEEPLRDGMAITIEPGLYIPTSDLYPNRFHGIGVRIEDDLILTGDGCENLTERVPREVAEIESLMS